MLAMRAVSCLTPVTMRTLRGFLEDSLYRTVTH